MTAPTAASIAYDKAKAAYLKKLGVTSGNVVFLSNFPSSSGDAAPPPAIFKKGQSAYTDGWTAYDKAAFENGYAISQGSLMATVMPNVSLKNLIPVYKDNGMDGGELPQYKVPKAILQFTTAVPNASTTTSKYKVIANMNVGYQWNDVGLKTPVNITAGHEITGDVQTKGTILGGKYTDGSTQGMAYKVLSKTQGHGLAGTYETFFVPLSNLELMGNVVVIPEPLATSVAGAYPMIKTLLVVVVSSFALYGLFKLAQKL